jgi:hypothetical protein
METPPKNLLEDFPDREKHEHNLQAEKVDNQWNANRNQSDQYPSSQSVEHHHCRHGNNSGNDETEPPDEDSVENHDSDGPDDIREYPPLDSFQDGNMIPLREDHFKDDQQEAQAANEGCGEPREEGRGQTPVGSPGGLGIAEDIDGDSQDNKNDTDEEVHAQSQEIQGPRDDRSHYLSPYG